MLRNCNPTLFIMWVTSDLTHQEGKVNLGLEGEERQPQEHGHRQPRGLDHDRPLRKQNKTKNRGQYNAPAASAPAPPPPRGQPNKLPRRGRPFFPFRAFMLHSTARSARNRRGY